MFTSICELRSGMSRQFTTYNDQTKDKTIKIMPGEKCTIASSDKSGIITRLWMTFPRWFWAHWEPGIAVDPSIMKKLIIRVYWDGKDEPSVESPVGDFFGIGHCEYRQYLSKFLGMSSGGFYCYFPMPYEKVRIELENMHESLTADIFFNANYQEVDRLPVNAGRFHCLFRTRCLDGKDTMMIMETKGRGHYAGCCVSIQAEEMNYLSFLEAPEHITIDTDDYHKPTIVGTGCEDYFNGGWYFREGEFSGMYHGVPIKDALRSMISMYRFHENDAVNFNKNIRVSFVNHWKGGRLKPIWYSSTAYWYQNKAVPLMHALPPVDQMMSMYRIRNVDHQSLP